MLLHSGDTGLIALAEAQLQGLASLQRRVDQARGSDLVAIRNEVVAVAAAAQVAAQQAKASPAMAAGLSLQEASERARRTVLGFVDDYYEKKAFDPYLRFSSAEDEAAFRKREAERKVAIDAALADGTPQGNLRAAQLMQDQVRDAGAHGADRSPDYAPMLAQVTGAKDDLGAAIAAQPKPAKVSSVDPLDAIAPATPIVVSEADQAEHGLTTGSTAAVQGRTT